MCSFFSLKKKVKEKKEEKARFWFCSWPESKWNELFSSNWEHPKVELKTEPKFEYSKQSRSHSFMLMILWCVITITFSHSLQRRVRYICWPFSRLCLSRAHISFSFVCYFSWRWMGTTFRLLTISNDLFRLPQCSWGIEWRPTLTANRTTLNRNEFWLNHSLWRFTIPVPLWVEYFSI